MPATKELQPVTRAAAKFDYASLAKAARGTVIQRTHEIRDRIGRAAQNVIEIGQRLIEVKGLLGHGQFGAWLDAEFAWSERTARRMMDVGEQFKTANLADLTIAPSALYLLASPSTPEPIREQFIEQAVNGTPVTHAEVKDAVEEAKEPPAPLPAKKKADAPKPAATEPAAEKEEPPAPVDQTEWPIPSKLQPALVDGRIKGREALSAITVAAKACRDFLNNVGGEEGEEGEFNALIGNVRAYITGVLPHAVCRTCGGRGCRACDKRGWLGKFRYEQTTPKELKEQTPPAKGAA